MSGRPQRPNLPAPPASLGAEDAARLEQLVVRALAEQRRETREALERAFDHVPWLLRAPIRKILGA